MKSDKAQQKSLLMGAAVNPRDEVVNQMVRAGKPETKPPVMGAKHLGRVANACGKQDHQTRGGLLSFKLARAETGRTADARPKKADARGKRYQTRGGLLSFFRLSKMLPLAALFSLAYGASQRVACKVEDGTYVIPVYQIPSYLDNFGIDYALRKNLLETCSGKVDVTFGKQQREWGLSPAACVAAMITGVLDSTQTPRFNDINELISREDADLGKFKYIFVDLFGGKPEASPPAASAPAKAVPAAPVAKPAAKPSEGLDPFADSDDGPVTPVRRKDKRRSKHKRFEYKYHRPLPRIPVVAMYGKYSHKTGIAISKGRTDNGRKHFQVILDEGKKKVLFPIKEIAGYIEYWGVTIDHPSGPYHKEKGVAFLYAFIPDGPFSGKKGFMVQLEGVEDPQWFPEKAVKGLYTNDWQYAK